jgi:hypothetical protein
VNCVGEIETMRRHGLRVQLDRPGQSKPRSCRSKAKPPRPAEQVDYLQSVDRAITTRSSIYLTFG